MSTKMRNRYEDMMNMIKILIKQLRQDKNAYNREDQDTSIISIINS